MINDLYILKSGLPIFNQNFEQNLTGKPPKVKSDDDQVTMISGFFSAINSFAATVGDFGHIRELRMNNVKFSFLKIDESECEDLLFVCSSDYKNNQKITEDCLNRIAVEFIQEYPQVLADKWKGKTDIFDKFRNKTIGILDSAISASLRNPKAKHRDSNFFSDERSKIDSRLAKRVSADSLMRMNQVEKSRRRESFQNLKSRSVVRYDKELFYNLIPIKRVDEDKSIYDIFSGKDSVFVYKKIDGTETIKEIARSTGIKKERVFHLCKSFIKMGLISFTK